VGDQLLALLGTELPGAAGAALDRRHLGCIKAGKLPDEPPELTPAAARALLAILIERPTQSEFGKARRCRAAI
jgi:hypothetical protein